MVAVAVVTGTLVEGGADNRVVAVAMVVWMGLLLEAVGGVIVRLAAVQKPQHNIFGE